ncbi:hypothetical protein [Mesorhizobium australicum]|uniref:Cyclodipeptide synthase n=1 Tax=Mesorhizobium australicum TaxID=536018 RepID=A0A1X7MZ47_9HYPH|nr:hypothetical protein [Mesorhizobium australicum]SMH30170.1 Cyclodipeptide synthase [Mesorhizobium australicum]
MPTDYRVTINGRYGTLEASAARLQVSVGNPRYEGRKLEALADFCRRRYENTTVVLSDTLQRHNLPEPQRYWMACRREGQEWLERNRAALHGLTIRRWDDYLMDPRYASARALIDKLTASGPAHEAILALAERQTSIPIERSLSFLREELAVFSFMMEDKAIDIYAGSWITPAIRELKLPAFDCIRCLSVDLERKRTAKPDLALSA